MSALVPQVPAASVAPAQSSAAAFQWCTYELSLLERLLYKHKNQHRKAEYFHKLMEIRRAERKIKEEIKKMQQANAWNLTASATAVRGTGREQLQQRLRALDSFAVSLLAAQSLILKCSRLLYGLLAQTYFMAFALACLAILARMYAAQRTMLIHTLQVAKQLHEQQTSSVASDTSRSETSAATLAHLLYDVLRSRLGIEQEKDWIEVCGECAAEDLFTNLGINKAESDKLLATAHTAAIQADGGASGSHKQQLRASPSLVETKRTGGLQTLPAGPKSWPAVAASPSDSDEGDSDEEVEVALLAEQDAESLHDNNNDDEKDENEEEEEEEEEGAATAGRTDEHKMSDEEAPPVTAVAPLPAQLSFFSPAASKLKSTTQSQPKPKAVLLQPQLEKQVVKPTSKSLASISATSALGNQLKRKAPEASVKPVAQKQLKPPAASVERQQQRPHPKAQEMSSEDEEEEAAVVAPPPAKKPKLQQLPMTRAAPLPSTSNKPKPTAQTQVKASVVAAAGLNVQKKPISSREQEKALPPSAKTESRGASPALPKPQRQGPVPAAKPTLSTVAPPASIAASKKPKPAGSAKKAAAAEMDDIFG
jgi:hypothetical protein